MIPGDYLYTNYLCRIITLIKGNAYYDGNPSGKFVKVKIWNEEFFFRYDENSGEFILKNPYGEKHVDSLIKSLMAAFIYKGLKDAGREKREIIINGEKIRINIQTLYLLMKLREFMDEKERFDRPPLFCNQKCIFKKICHLPELKVDNFINEITTHEFFTIVHTYATYLLYDDLYSATVRFINDNLDMEEEERKNARINKIKRKIVKDIGYEKADLVSKLADHVLNFYPLSKLNIDVSQYGGYLVEKNGYVYPSDKFWRPFLKRELESDIEKVYARVNGRNVTERTEVMVWD